MGQGLKTRLAGSPRSGGTAAVTESVETENTWKAPGIQGLDVSSHQPTVNWPAQYSMGARFAYVKASEGLTYRSPTFNSQYSGALSTGMLRGAYHFALPSISGGAAQADYFISSGGGWSPDGKTMPPLLDIEYNPYSSLGNTCYNMSDAAMVGWIRDFSNRMLARTGRLPMIYTTTDWWSQCTGNSGAFGNQPLHLANYSTYVGNMPNGWGTYSVWQYSSTGPLRRRLQRLERQLRRPAKIRCHRRRGGPETVGHVHRRRRRSRRRAAHSGTIRQPAPEPLAPAGKSARAGPGCAPST